MEPVIGAEDRVYANIQVTPDYKNIILFIENLKRKLGVNTVFEKNAPSMSASGLIPTKPKPNN